MTISNRIKELRKSENLSQEEFGNIIGFSRSIIGCYESGLRSVPVRSIKAICDKFNVNEEWLKYGTGEKYTLPPEINALAKSLADISLSNNNKLHKIVIMLSDLDDKYLDLIEHLIDVVSEEK